MLNCVEAQFVMVLEGNVSIFSFALGKECSRALADNKKN